MPCICQVLILLNICKQKLHKDEKCAFFMEKVHFFFVYKKENITFVED